MGGGGMWRVVRGGEGEGRVRLATVISFHFCPGGLIIEGLQQSHDRPVCVCGARAKRGRRHARLG